MTRYSGIGPDGYPTSDYGGSSGPTASTQSRTQSKMTNVNPWNLAKSNAAAGRNQILKNYLDELDLVGRMPAGDIPDFGGNGSNAGPGGGGYGPPPLAPLVLPRMQQQHPWQAAKEFFDATAFTDAPFVQAINNLNASKMSGQQEIGAADRQARQGLASTSAAFNRDTEGTEQKVAAAYQQAMRALSASVQGNNQAMMDRGFKPGSGFNSGLQALAQMGAASSEASLVRRNLGQRALQEAAMGVGAITQAGTGTLSSTYQAVLGNINTQRAQAIAGAQFQVQQQQQALAREIDRINYEASVREAEANR